MRVMIVRRVLGSAFSLEVYADNLVTALRVVRPNWEIAEVAPIPWSRPDKLYLSGLGLKKYYETFVRHPRAVSRLEADIFHVIDQCEAHVAYGLERANKPVVVTCHDLVQLIYPEILRDQSRIPALSLAMWKYAVGGMKNADHIISVSSNTAKDVNQLLDIGLDQITVVPNGTNPEFRVLPNTEVTEILGQYKRATDMVYLLNVGSTHHRKNILTVLKVLNTLKEKEVPVCLWRTGDIFTKEQKAFIQEHNLESYIVDFGNPDKAQLIQIYNAADILLAPSLYEGFGLTVVEAMACGLPVITSNVSSLPEVAGEAAVLIDPLNVEAIIEAIFKIKQDSNFRDQLIQKGIVRAKFFSWIKTAEQVAKVYENVLLKKSSELVN